MRLVNRTTVYHEPAIEKIHTQIKSGAGAPFWKKWRCVRLFGSTYSPIRLRRTVPSA
jgi:hypothetical protein